MGERLEITWGERQIALLRDTLEPVASFINDPDITDILLRPSWTSVERLSGGFEIVGGISPQRIIATTLKTLAGALGKELSIADPEIEITLRLDKGGPRLRFTGVYAGAGGCDSLLTIRIARVLKRSLDDCIASGVVPQQVVGPLTAELSLPSPRGILVAGPVGAGKTTLLRMLIQETMARAPYPQHFVIVEDEIELDFDEPLVTNLETTRHFTFADAIRQSKRHRPTRLIVGETRGAEALDAVKAGANGAGLMMSVHGRTAAIAVRTVRSYMAEGAGGIEPDPALISDAISMILVMARVKGSFTIKEAVMLNSVDREGAISCTSLLA